MLTCYTKLTGSERTIYRNVKYGHLSVADTLYLALADENGHIARDTVQNFHTKDGYFDCEGTLRDHLTDGGLFSGLDRCFSEVSLLHEKYSLSGFKRHGAIPVEGAKYLVIGTGAPSSVPRCLLEETVRLEQNPYYRGRGEYLASIGAEDSPELYEGNLLVSRPQWRLPEAVLTGSRAIVPLHDCGACRVYRKANAKGLTVGLEVLFGMA